MILTQLPWSQVPDGSLVVGPSGQVWRFRRIALPGPPTVHLADPEHVMEPRLFVVDPAATTTVMLPSGPTNTAISVVRQFFPDLEVIG